VWGLVEEPVNLALAVERLPDFELRGETARA
jgi:hypothetical protein